MQRFTFRPKHRLLTKRDFSRVFEKVDHRVSKGPLILLARKNGLDHPRIGLVVRKKFLKKAVDRNQLKRLARENFRLRQHQIANLDIIFMNRSKIELDNKVAVNEMIGSLFERLPYAKEGKQ